MPTWGLTAVFIAASLTLLGSVDEQQAIRRMPWGVILMVTGGDGADLAHAGDPGHGPVHERAGRHLHLGDGGADDGVRDRPDIGVQQHVRRGDAGVPADGAGPSRSRSAPSSPSIWRGRFTVGGGLVDLSALSTVGALFLAAAPPGTDTRALFNALLAWGLSMSVVGAALCWLLFG